MQLFNLSELSFVKKPIAVQSQKLRAGSVVKYTRCETQAVRVPAQRKKQDAKDASMSMGKIQLVFATRQRVEGLNQKDTAVPTSVVGFDCVAGESAISKGLTTWLPCTIADRQGNKPKFREPPLPGRQRLPIEELHNFPSPQQKPRLNVLKQLLCHCHTLDTGPLAGINLRSTSPLPSLPRSFFSMCLVWRCRVGQ